MADKIGINLLKEKWENVNGLKADVRKKHQEALKTYQQKVQTSDNMLNLSCTYENQAYSGLVKIFDMLDIIFGNGIHGGLSKQELNSQDGLKKINNLVEKASGMKSIIKPTEASGIAGYKKINIYNDIIEVLNVAKEYLANIFEHILNTNLLKNTKTEYLKSIENTIEELKRAVK